MGGFVIASNMTQAGMGIQMLIGAGNFVIALIMMYGVIGIPMLMNTGSFVVTQHIIPLSKGRGVGGVRPVLVLLKSKFPHLALTRWGNG